MRTSLLAVLVALCACQAAPAPPARTGGELRWGGDAEGGAPFVEADAADPSKVRGFDVEIAGMIAAGLGRQPRFLQVAWASIEQSVERGDFDVGLSGLEDRPELRARQSVSIPY
jgi:polar amino acid transport system substrate-binding protein